MAALSFSASALPLSPFPPLSKAINNKDRQHPTFNPSRVISLSQSDHRPSVLLPSRYALSLLLCKRHLVCRPRVIRPRLRLISFPVSDSTLCRDAHRFLPFASAHTYTDIRVLVCPSDCSAQGFSSKRGRERENERKLPSFSLCSVSSSPTISPLFAFLSSDSRRCCLLSSIFFFTIHQSLHRFFATGLTRMLRRISLEKAV